MPRPLALVPLAALALAACAEEHVDGGPCRYDSSETTARVVEVDTTGGGDLVTVAVEVAGLGAEADVAGDRETFSVPRTRLPDGFAVGDRVAATVDRIVEGTCTPVIIDVPVFR